jgi:heme-degrading monooxygenase HmoA
MIIRVFDTAVDPEDVGRVKQLHHDQVGPAFSRFEGCLGLYMGVRTEEHSRDLVDVVAISKWESLDAIERAIGSEAYAEALHEMRRLYQQSPIVRHFEVFE